MPYEKLRIITQEERVSMDPGGSERVSRSGGHPDALLLGSVTFFGEQPAIYLVEQETEGEQ